MVVLRAARRPVVLALVAALVGAVLAVATPATDAQAVVESPLTLGYDKQVYGDFLTGGNGMMVCPASGYHGTSNSDRTACLAGSTRSAPNANDSYYMSATGADTTKATPWFDSSSISLTVPSGSKVDYAQLSWAGNTGVASGVTGTSCSSAANAASRMPTMAATATPANTKPQLVVGANSPVSVTAARLTTDQPANLTSGVAQYYSGAANVTSAFKDAPTGSALNITAANVFGVEGPGCMAGWALILVYDYGQSTVAVPSQREVFIYDGHVRVLANTTVTTKVSGFRANGQAKVGVVAYEGDYALGGDNFLINGSAQTDPAPGGSSTNFFTSYALNESSPNYSNNYSVDAKSFSVPTSVIPSGATTANLSFTTAQDTYLAEDLVMSVPIPDLRITKTASPTIVHPGDNITWTITVTNPSSAVATNVAVTDALVPACARTIGILIASQTTTYTCTSAAPATGGVITNTANVTGTDSFNTALTGTAAVPVTVLAPAITIAKTADQSSYHVGDTVTYTIKVTNTGNADLTGVAVTDPTNASCARAVGALAAGDSTTYTCTATAPVTDNSNTANVGGADQLGRTVTGTSTVPVPVIRPALTLVKSAVPTTVTAAGQTVAYSFKVTNTGDAPITALSIADTPVAPSGPTPTISCPTTTLAVSASTTCTGTYTVTQADADQGTIVDNAVANAKDPLNAAVASNPSQATVTVTRSPKLTLTKTATPTTVSTVGGTVSYSFLVTNTGNVTVQNIAITDAFDNPADTVPTITCPATTLAPAAATRCTASYAATQADFDQGSINNTATATGTGANGAAVTSPNSLASVTASTAPSISLVKTASPTTITAKGQVVSYSFLVTNTGNQTLTNLTIADTLAAPAGPEPTITCPKTTLLPGGTTTCTASYPATQADVDNGSIKNAAIARSTDPKGNPVNSAQSNATVTVTAAPALTVVKSATPGSITTAGQTVAYSFVVTNTGNVTVKNVAIADTFTSPAGPALAINCPATTLAPAATTTCTASYIATQADVDNGSIKNSAAATGTDPSGAAVTSPTSSAAVTIPRTSQITLLKSATPATVTAVGQNVTYSFLVTNTGNQTVTSLSVADTLTAPAGPPLTIGCPITTLAPAGTTACTATYKVTQADLDNGTIDNSAVATSRDPLNATVTSNPSTATVTATTTAGLTIVKSASPMTITAPGVGITYSFLVTNSGSTTVSSLVVNDPKFTGAVAPSCPVTTLAPGASTTCTATYISTQADVNAGSITNTATAAGVGPKGDPVTSLPSSVTVTVTQTPQLTLTKSATPARVQAVGDTISYTFAVTNAGNVTVTGLAIGDTFSAPAGPPLAPITCLATALVPGASTTCTATYPITQADLNAGSINNSAVATAKDPNNATVTSNTSTASVSATATPKLVLVKSAGPATVTTVGATVTYTFAVTNSGNVTVTGLTVADTFTAPAGPPLAPITCVATTVAPGDTTSCTATYTVTQADADAGSIRNSATASAQDPSNHPVVSNGSSATVSITQAPKLTIAKSAVPTTITAAGQSVTYSFLVTNSGNVTIANVAVADTFSSPAGPPVTPSCPPGSLQPGASVTCTATYTASQADVDNGSIKNTATASGTDPAGNGVTSTPSSATVSVTQAPALAVVKAAAPLTVTASGQTINYTFTATNNGNVTLTLLNIADTLSAPASPEVSVSCPATTIAPAQVVVCTGTYTVTQADMDDGQINNSATAKALDPNGNPVASTPSTATVGTTRTPSLSLAKTVAPNSVTSAGQTLTYSFVVTNTGTVTIRSVAISDALAAPAGPQLTGITCGATTLAPNDTTTCTAGYTTTQADVDNGSITNTATAAGTGPTGTTVTSNPSTAAVTAAPAPALTLVKSAQPATVTAAGQSVTYTFTVTNTGNVTVGAIAITDPMFTGANAPTCVAASLVPAASTTCSATYVTTQADIDGGSVVNTATAGGTTPGGAAVTSPASTVTVNVTAAPAITLVKSAAPTTVVAAGATVTYSFLVTNTGNVTLHAVAITDRFTVPAGPPLTIICPLTTLAPADATTCTGTYVATQADIDKGEIDNQATAAGLDPSNAPVGSGPSSAKVTVTQSPTLTMVKSAGPAAATTAGQKITYTFLVSNTGNVTLSLLAISDAFTAPAAPALTVNCPDRTLAPNAQATCTGVYTVTQQDVDTGGVANTATANAQTPDGATVTSPPSSVTTGISAAPALTVAKSAAPTSFDGPGQTISYSFLVTNTGNVTVSAVAITDPMFTGDAAATCSVSVLAPGASTTCAATYVTTQADVDAGTITNTATAGGTAPDDAPVTSPSSTATVTATQTATLTLVKSANPQTVTTVGEGVRYTFTVSNTGNVTIDNLAVTDQFAGAAGPGSAISCDVTSLAPGTITTCSSLYVTTQADFDLGTVSNTATAHGTNPAGTALDSNPSSAVVTADQAPALTLAKKANPSSVSAVGDNVVYSFVVTNSGTLTIHGLTIADTLAAPATPELSPTCADTTLASDATTTCTATYTVQQADLDAGSLNNSAVANGLDPAEAAVASPPSTATVAVTGSAALTVAKTATPATITRAGDVVTYSFLVTNSGTLTVHGIAIADPLLPGAAAPTCLASSLAPTETTTCTATYAATQGDVDRGTIHNTATATGLDPKNTPVNSPPSTADVTATGSPSVTVVKSATPAAPITAAGQTIDYSFLVTNTGNVTLTGLAVSDTLTPPAAPALTLDCPGTTLAPGGALTCTATYTTTQADIDNGSVSNTATVAGQAPDGSTVPSDPSTATVAIAPGPALTLTKSVDPTTSPVGAVVVYSFLVTNTGNVTVSNLAIDDTLATPATPALTIRCPVTSLAPAASTTCTANYRIKQDDGDHGGVDNRATATGTAPGGATVTSNESTASVTIPSNPGLTLAKSADPSTVAAVGDQVTYSFLVTNSGDVTVHGITIADTFTAPAGPALSIGCPVSTLAPAASTTCTATYATTQDDLDAGTIQNSATASALSPTGAPVSSAASTANVTATQSPALTLVKSAAPAVVTAAEQSVTYTFLITNTGNVTVTSPAVADVIDAPAAPPLTVDCDQTPLAPTKSVTCTATYTTTQADIDDGSITNTATATATDPAGHPVTSPPSSAIVSVTQTTGLSLVKSADPTTITAAGQTVTYSFLVTNTGNVTVQGLSIADSFLAPAAPALAITCPTATLGPDDTTTCTGTYTVTQADVDHGVIDNNATASGTDPNGASVTSPSATAEVTIPQTSSLTVVKSAAPTTVTAAGQAVTYSFLVTNTGNTTLQGVHIDDVFTAPGGPTPTITCPDLTLAPQGTTTCAATYRVSQADVDHGGIDNSATATGTDPNGAPVTSPASPAHVDATRTGSLSVIKTSSVGTVSTIGRSITYSFLVTNTGNVTITDVAVGDVLTAPAGPELVPSCPATTLTPGQQTTCTADYTVTRGDLDHGSITNTATASGTAPDNQPVTSDPSSVTVGAIAQPGIALVKHATVNDVNGNGKTDLHDTISWTFTVTNTGNVSLDPVTITDATAGTVTCPSGPLAAGTSVLCTADSTHEITQADVDLGHVDNTATASGTDPFSTPVTSAPSSTSTVIPTAPSLALMKSADRTTVTAAGQTVNYSFLVTNDGDVTIDGIAITDVLAAPAGPALAVTCPVTTLGPTDSTTCTAAYLATQDDLDAGSIDNSATAAGTDPAGGTVTSPGSNATVGAAAAPMLTVAKTASPTTVDAVGQTIAYNFLVTNTGNVTVSGIAVADTLTAPAGPALTVDCPVTTLAPTKATTCTADYLTTQADLDAGTVKNSATASGTDPHGTPVTSDPDDVTVTATQNPTLTVAKSADPLTVDAAGDTVAYSFLVTNTGNVTVAGIAIDDSLTAPAGPALTVACPLTTLAPTTSTVCTGTYTVTLADMNHGTIQNSATATGATLVGTPVSSTPSDAEVTVDQSPALNLVKAADPQTVTTIGQSVTYTFTVTNTGNVTISGLAIDDTLTAPAGPPLTPTCPVTTLNPGRSTICSADYTVTPADFDAGSVANTATATGTAPAGGPVTSLASDATVTATPLPSISLTKIATVTDVDGDGVTGLDDTIQWTFTVTNTGNVSLSPVAITDQVAGAVTCPAGPLAAGSVITCTADAVHVITQADVDAGHVDNSAEVDGTDPNGTLVTDHSSTSTLIGPRPSLTLTKNGSVVDVDKNGRADVGDRITWTFAVTNTGNVTLTGLTVDDPTAGRVTCPATTLAPGRSTTCTADRPHPLTAADLDRGSVTNTATAGGTAPGGDRVTTPPSTATVPLAPEAALALTKSAAVTDRNDNGVHDAGDAVTWKFLVTNSGNVTVRDIAVDDPSAGPIACPHSALTAGSSMTCASRAHTITVAEASSGRLTNTATVHGVGIDGGTITSPPSTATVRTPGAGTEGAGSGRIGSGGPADTGAKYLPQLLGYGGGALLLGILLLLTGLVRRRRNA